jgi:hypothetical protein
VKRQAGDNIWLGCPVDGCHFVHAAKKQTILTYEFRRLGKESYLNNIEPW